MIQITSKIPQFNSFFVLKWATVRNDALEFSFQTSNHGSSSDDPILKIMPKVDLGSGLLLKELSDVHIHNSQMPRFFFPNSHLSNHHVVSAIIIARNVGATNRGEIPNVSLVAAMGVATEGSIGTSGFKEDDGGEGSTDSAGVEGCIMSEGGKVGEGREGDEGEEGDEGLTGTEFGLRDGVEKGEEVMGGAGISK